MISTFIRRVRHHQASTKVSSLALLLQRSPLVKILLPEARVISTSGFSDALQWTVTAIAGLGAFDAVSGATTLTQLQPSFGNLTVPATGGSNLNFVYQCLVTDGFIPGSFEVVGTLPAGLTQTGLKNSTVDSITGTPVQPGNFPVKITAYEFTNNTGRFLSVNFNISVAVPPAPSFSVHPAGGNFPAGAFTLLNSTQTGGYSFTWKKNGTALAEGESLLFSRSAPRKFFFPPEDPGTEWRTGAAYDDSAWTSVSGGIGYDLQTGPVNYNPEIAAGGNVQAQMSGTDKPMSVFLRMPFDLTTPMALSHLKLRVQSDDGFVAYLNGSEIASQNKPVPNDFIWESNAVAAQPDATAVTFREINLTNRIPLLRAGTNLLAVQAMNDTYESPDFLFNCELAGGINAANSTRLVLAGLLPSDGGSYTVTATNPAGSATSNPAVINVAPVITSHPASVSIAPGATATLTAAAEGEPLTWQWFRGAAGDTANPITGAIADSFTTPPLSATTTYWARVTNPAGTDDSLAATVTVTVLPTVESFTDWQSVHFTPAQIAEPSVSGSDADPDGDGMANGPEYVFGTLPLSPDPSTSPTLSANLSQLSFVARSATGPGYAGRVRHYAIQTTGNLAAGPWTSPPGFEDITGQDQTVTYSLPQVSGSSFFRLKVSLTP